MLDQSRTSSNLIDGVIQLGRGRIISSSAFRRRPVGAAAEITVLDQIIPACGGCLFHLDAVHVNRACIRCQQMWIDCCRTSCGVSNLQSGPITVCRQNFTTDLLASVPHDEICPGRTGFNICREGVGFSSRHRKTVPIYARLSSCCGSNQFQRLAAQICCFRRYRAGHTTVTQMCLDGKSTIVQKDRTKTKSSYRTLPLVEPFEELLLRLKEEQAQNRKLCGRSYSKKYTEYIYVDQLGQLIKPGYITQHFSQVLEKNDLRRFASTIFAIAAPACSTLMVSA